MKIAIFHNFLDNIGGAEIVTLILARELKADIFTTNICQEKIKKLGFNTSNIFSIGSIPINAPFRQEFAYWKFKFLNLNTKYDFYIIAGDWAMSGAKHNHPNLWYIHSPTREIWDLYSYSRQNIVKTRPFGFITKYIFDLWVLFHQIINKNDVKYVDKFVCNSQNVKARVKKYLLKDSVVINPPIETEKYKHSNAQNYWLSVNRLINHKRIEIQLDAFKLLPNENLIMVGSYEDAVHFKGYAQNCIKNKPSNVTIKSWVSSQELINLHANCKGFITTAYDEDFGMTVLEAMASGKPVIAPNEGGYKETVLQNKTGFLIDNLSAQNLAEAIKNLSQELLQNPEKYKENCFIQSQNFDLKIFINKIKQQINLP